MVRARWDYPFSHQLHMDRVGKIDATAMIGSKSTDKNTLTVIKSL